MKIQIKVVSVFEKGFKINIDSQNKKFVCNGRDVNYPIDDFVQRLFDIIVSWGDEKSIMDIVDAETCEIIVEKEQIIRKFVGNGVYPQNYKEFKKLLEEVTKC